ncbi:hypothetical protein [Marinobacterium jannaschii]|uniref:hypothetical protein n=1 Tax=Marinobacterium jannaschii TaxID=64970 RepID=UPI000486BAC8|nr:hypothetical protein [Marinobacterium jannaschii]
MAPIVDNGEYDGNDPEPQVVWTADDLIAYHLDSGPSESFSEKVGNELRHYSVEFAVRNDGEHAVVLLQNKNKQLYELLIDLKLIPIRLDGDYAGKTAYQVTGVDGTRAQSQGFSNRGYAKTLYRCTARLSQSLIVSDNYQHDPGKFLWQAIGAECDVPDALTVRIYHARLKTVLKECSVKGFQFDTGTPVEYDGENVPEDIIWGFNKESVLLVAEPPTS